MSKVKQNRHIELPGTTNLRDMGGYPTTGGKHTKWGVMYRGEQLSEVSPNDAQDVLVNQMRVTTTYDFRVPEEAAVKMYNIPGIEQKSFPTGTTHMLDYAKSGKPFTPEVTFNLMVEVYHAFSNENAHVFGGVLKDLVACKPSTDSAFIIHCTAGKDRTGLCCYLLLRLLGVCEDNAREDYLLTNKYFKQPHDADKYLGGFGMDAACMKVHWTVDGRFLDAVVEEIDKAGGLEEYAHKKLGLTTEDINSLKELFLE